VGHRLSRIYTRTGDDGTTGLANGERVVKYHVRVQAIGDVDELNSAVGLILAGEDVPDDVRAVLDASQHELFEIGAELSLPGYRAIGAPQVERLETDLDRLNEELPPLENFILPGGGPSAAAAHLARAVCRRAERTAWRLAKEAEVNPELLRYLNRFSDLLFVMARVLARRGGSGEVLWNKPR
jgi:cob(I)alamin adenosyltransferase